VKGPFVTEGVIQGGLGGLVASLLLWTALSWLSGNLASSDLLPHATLTLSPEIAAVLVVLGMAVGLAGSLISLSRLEV
jgi:cell division protein FtsX